MRLIRAGGRRRNGQVGAWKKDNTNSSRWNSIYVALKDNDGDTLEGVEMGGGGRNEGDIIEEFNIL